MIALYIIAGVIALLFVLLVIPAAVEVKISEEASVTLKYAFLRFKLFPSDKDKEEKPAAGKKEEKPSKKTGGEGTVRRLIREKGVSGALEELIALVKRVFKGVTGLLRHIKIKRFRLLVTVATDDAARTGVEYGAVCAALYPALGLLGSFCELGRAEYGVTADFDSEESKIEFEGLFSVLPLFVLTAAIYVAFGYIKLRISDNKNNGKQRKG